jgi:hypothetical protein
MGVMVLALASLAILMGYTLWSLKVTYDSHPTLGLWLGAALVGLLGLVGGGAWVVLWVGRVLATEGSEEQCCRGVLRPLEWVVAWVVTMVAEDNPDAKALTR